MSYHRSALSGTSSPALAGDAFPEPWGSYGQKAATAILSRVAALPPKLKKREMKKLLDKIDSSLWSRTSALTKRYIAAGQPPPAALRAGLARAMSAGVVAELARTGKAGKFVAKGQLGALGGVLTAASTERVTSVTSGAPKTSAGVSTGSSDGVCTSDSKLIRVAGKWRVRAPADVCVSTIASEDVNYVIKSGQKVYVGPFAIDLTATGGQITTIAMPSQLPQEWRNWFAHAALVAGQALAAGGKNITIVDWPNKSGWQTDGTKGWITDGTGAIVPMNVNKPASYWSTKASGGHAYWPNSIIAGLDGSGLPTHHTQYANDPNTYDYYSVYDWLAALGIAKGYPSGLIDMTNPLTGANTTEYNPPFNLAPVAKWNHPVTGELWGTWIAITIQNNRVYDGAWDTSTDAPGTYVMQVGLAPIPSEPWYDSILDALLWLPGLVGDLLGDLGDLIGTLACAAASSPKAAAGAGSAAGPAGAAAAAGGALIVNDICTGGKGSGPPVVGKQSAFLPLAIAGGVLAAIYVITKPKKKSTPAAKTPA